LIFTEFLKKNGNLTTRFLTENKMLTKHILLLELMQSLRKAIAEKIYPNMGITDTEVFISDGAQCDIARLQVL
jgi:hypothetical protein